MGKPHKQCPHGLQNIHEPDEWQFCVLPFDHTQPEHQTGYTPPTKWKDGEQIRDWARDAIHTWREPRG